jgi:OOP family OmpA-OmpF porin
MDHIRGSDALLWLLSLLVCSAVFFSACATASKIRADAEVVKRDIATARENGAYTCAPQDLAMAESHVRFTLDELKQGNSSRAKEHVKIAAAAVKAAIENSPVATCGPKKPVVTIKKFDRDDDGVPDVDDACPDDPGIANLRGCPDRDSKER